MDDKILMRFSWVYGCWIRESIGIKIANGLKLRHASIETLSSVFHPHGLSDFFNWGQSNEGYDFWQIERHHNYFRQSRALDAIRFKLGELAFNRNRPYLELYFT